jgi:hypothetical protein
MIVNRRKVSPGSFYHPDRRQVTIEVEKQRVYPSYLCVGFLIDPAGELRMSSLIYRDTRGRNSSVPAYFLV